MGVSRKTNKFYKYTKYNIFIYKYGKFIPIIGIILLLLLFFNNNNNSPNVDSNNSLSKISETIFFEFTNSFNFSDIMTLFSTILLMMIIWTGYKYWLMKARVIRRNSKLVENLIFAILLLVFSVHINFNSTLGKLFDFAYFFILLYVVLAGSWFSAKIIDSFNLEQDLYCWGLRVLGIIFFIFGGIILMAGGLTVVISSNNPIFNNILWIAGLCIMALGGFCEYRSIRRHGVFVYIR